MTFHIALETLFSHNRLSCLIRSSSHVYSHDMYIHRDVYHLTSHKQHQFGVFHNHKEILSVSYNPTYIYIFLSMITHKFPHMLLGLQFVCSLSPSRIVKCQFFQTVTNSSFWNENMGRKQIKKYGMS